MKAVPFCGFNWFVWLNKYLLRGKGISIKKGCFKLPKSVLTQITHNTITQAVCLFSKLPFGSLNY